MFVARWFLADWTSYWHDELLSINVYGQWHASAADAIRHLASRSIHPPLYQLTLYYWMQLLGDTEIATRSLSNLYIALATWFLYLLLNRTYSVRIAFISVAVFSAMYAPIFVALETRSYAQTIFLATVSFDALFGLLQKVRENQISWRSLVRWPGLAALIFANAGLLLTHYYNFFVVASQGVFLVGYLLWKKGFRDWMRRLELMTLVFGGSLLIFGAIWGGIFIASVQRSVGPYTLQEGPRNPFALLRDDIVVLNFDPPVYILTLLAVLVSLVVIRSVYSILKNSLWTPTVERAWMVTLLCAWLVGPAIVAYLAFLSSGVARYNLRYFLFSVPPLAPLLVLTLETGWNRVDLIVRRLRRESSSLVARSLTVILVAILWIAPGGLEAATHVKHEWRGIIKSVVDVVEADPDHSYIIFETGYRRESMTNYYFERFSSDVRAFDTLQRSEEAEGSYRILTSQADEIATHDFLVILFTHSLPGHFPNALEALEARYGIYHRQINHVGRGFIIFDVSET